MIDGVKLAVKRKVLSSPTSLEDGLRGELLTEWEVAEYLHLSVQTVRDWRKSRQRRGPSYVKIERRPVRYRLADLKAYLKARTVLPRASK